MGTHLLERFLYKCERCTWPIKSIVSQRVSSEWVNWEVLVDHAKSFGKIEFNNVSKDIAFLEAKNVFLNDDNIIWNIPTFN